MEYRCGDAEPVKRYHLSRSYQFYCLILGQPLVKRFVLCYGTVVLSVSNVGVLWPNGWMDQDTTWYGGRFI